MRLCTFGASAALALSLLGPVGCAGTDPAATPEAPAAQAEAPLTRSALSALSPATLLPADTLAVVGSESVAPMLERLGYRQIVDRFADRYAELTAEVQKETGFDLMDPWQLAALGIDPSAPAGLAWLDASRDRVALFATLSDAEAFETAARSILARHEESFDRLTLGDATILTSAKERAAHIVLRGGFVFLVLSDVRDGEDPLATAGRLADVTPATSLASEPRFLAAAERGRPGQVFAYLNVGTVVRSFRALNAESDDPMASEPPGSDEDRKWRERWAEERRKGSLMVDALWGDGTTLSASASIDGARVLGALGLDVPDDALVHGLLKDSAGVASLLRVFDAPPLYAMAGSLDTDKLMGLIAALADIQGQGMDGVEAAVMKVLGLSLAKDVLDTLTGDVAFGLTVNPAGAADPSQAMGFHVAAGVRDEARARELIARVAAFPLVSGELRREGALWIVGKADSVRMPIYLGVAGGVVAITTDKAAFARLATKEVAPAAAQSHDAQLAALLAKPSPAALAIFDPSQLARFFSEEQARWSGEPYVPPLSTNPALPPEYFEKHAAMADLAKRLAVLEREERSAESRRVRAATEPLGTLAGSAQAVDGGLVAEGGLYTRAESIPALAEGLVALAVAALERDGEASQVALLRHDLWQKQTELEELARAYEPPAPPSVEGE